MEAEPAGIPGEDPAWRARAGDLPGQGHRRDRAAVRFEKGRGRGPGAAARQRAQVREADRAGDRSSRVGRESVIVLDTHALVWWAAGAAQLSARARRAIQSTARRAPVVASAISVFEITTAVRRGRLQLALPLEQWLADLRLLPELRFEPVSADIAQVAGAFEEAVPGDPADRIIIATALTLNARLVTADDRLRQARRVETVW
ncbi:MAG: type II toxin-antitoxin system VapC family toxin [Betaproteobacteria bacterium]|nr:type II toxin-antitoxin system VapC family toxin [Betaproteobacteria bacterium]